MGKILFMWNKKQVILIYNIETHGIGYNFGSPFWEENWNGS